MDLNELFGKAAIDRMRAFVTAPIPQRMPWLHLALRVVLLVTLPAIALGLLSSSVPAIGWAGLALGVTAGVTYSWWARRDTVVACAFHVRDAEGRVCARLEADERGVALRISTPTEQHAVLLGVSTDGTATLQMHVGERGLNLTTREGRPLLMLKTGGTGGKFEGVVAGSYAEDPVVRVIARGAIAGVAINTGGKVEFQRSDGAQGSPPA